VFFFQRGPTLRVGVDHGGVLEALGQELAAPAVSFEQQDPKAGAFEHPGQMVAGLTTPGDHHVLFGRLLDLE